MNIFKKKFIPIKTKENKFKNKKKKNNSSLIKHTNSQIIYQNNYNNSSIYENINVDNTIPTKSIKNTTIDDALYLEQNNYDNESSKNEKEIQNINYESSSKNFSTSNKNIINHDNLMIYKLLYDNETKKSSNISNENINTNKYSKLSYCYLNKSSSNKSKDKN